MQLTNEQFLSSLKPSAKDIRFAFFDVDGTLMNSAHAVTSATRAALNAFRSSGRTFGLASGRPYFGAKALMKDLEAQGISVLSSGALIVDGGTGSALFEEGLLPEQALPVIDFARRENLFIEVYTKDGYFAEYESHLGRIHAEYLGIAPTVAPFEEIFRTQPILKLEFAVDTPADAQKVRAYAAQNSSLTFTTGYGASHPGLVFVNVTSPLATREHAWERALSYLGIAPEEIIAFGDAEADIPFLKLAGIGVAMGNAGTSVQQAARCVTKPVDEDGVAFALRALFDLRW